MSTQRYQLHVGDYNIAFDPTGTIGWFSFLGHVTPGPSNYAFYPVLYKTTDGGVTWNGPIQVDLNNMSCITSNITAGNIPTANFEHDLVVDVNGNPHFLTTIGNGFNFYSINYATWHHMMDITQVNGVWTAYDIANVNAGRGSWGVSPNIATLDMAPQAARTTDGTKLFFTWSDNANYALGAANLSPDLFGRAYNVVTHQWTPVKNFTSCNPAIAGLVLFPHTAEEVLEPTLNTYKLATVYGEYTLNNDPAQISNFRFLDNVTFTNSDFSLNQPAAVVSIVQGTNVIACPSSSINISVNGIYEGLLWSNGAMNAVNPVNLPGQYIVTVMSGCNIGMDTITVTTLTTNLSTSVPTICAGASATLNATGNANSYVWTPGSTPGGSVVVTPAVNTVYYLAATGDQGCTETTTVGITVNPLPTLSVTGASSVCAGSTLSLSASGANTYLWNGVLAGSSATFAPSSTTTYTVAGTDLNLCTSSQTMQIAVAPLPNLAAMLSKTVICTGETVTLTASGASSFTLAGGGGTLIGSSSPASNTFSFGNVYSPTVSTTYTTTGKNVAGCSTFSINTITVAACTGFENAGMISGIHIRVFPNPSQGEVSLSSTEDLHLTLLNELGQVITTVSLNQGNHHRAEINGLAGGIYFIAGEYQNQLIRQKIVVIH